MKVFECTNCGHPVYFENYFCISCQASLGFDPQQMTMLALQPAAEGINFSVYNRKASNAGGDYKYCQNKTNNVCNWLIPQDATEQFCVACNLNRMIPDISQPGSWEKWARIEVAKHRLIYSLLRLKLSIASKFQNEKGGIAFDFKAEEKSFGERLLTGHENGLITLNIDEADDVIREMVRNDMYEMYRTLVGHFRHEIGHYYWDVLIDNTERLESFREIFGDERVDYAMALQQHYQNQSSPSWTLNYISAYAASHPWEDWAETWAHYLHIVDTLETGYSFGLSIMPQLARRDEELDARMDIDPYVTESIDDILQRWIPLSSVMNSLNRSMGMKDSYPFVISEAVKKKLKFIHETIHASELVA